jgi:hypothetical protein
MIGAKRTEKVFARDACAAYGSRTHGICAGRRTGINGQSDK